MFEDVCLKKICASTVDKPIAKGSFGSVYKVKIDVSLAAYFYWLFYGSIYSLQVTF